jgi:hypothetical protein
MGRLQHFYINILTGFTLLLQLYRLETGCQAEPFTKVNIRKFLSLFRFSIKAQFAAIVYECAILALYLRNAVFLMNKLRALNVMVSCQP